MPLPSALTERHGDLPEASCHLFVMLAPLSLNV